MKKNVLLSIVLLAALMLAACQPAAAPAAEAPAAEAPAAEAPAEETPVEERPKCVPVVCEDAAVETKSAADVEALCAADEWGCAKFESGQTIKIGMGSPMTGGDASFGIDAENSGKLAAADACTVAGFSFELIAEDDGGGAEGGAAVANKHAADPTIVAVAGHLFSGASFAARPIYEEAGIVMLSPSATNPRLSLEGSPVFNRYAFTDDMQAPMAAEFAYNTLGARKMAVLHDGEDYGKGLAELTRDSFEALGGEVVEFTGIVSKEADYTPVLSTIAAKSPDVLYFGGYTQDGGVLANQMKTTGLENAIFVGCDGTYGADFVSRTGANGEGSYHVAPRQPAETPAKDNFDNCYFEAYGKEAGELSPFTWNSYDTTTSLTLKVKEVAVMGDDGALYIPRGALIAAVRGIKDYVGVSGSYNCNENGDCNLAGPQFFEVVSGEFVAAN